MKTKRDRLRILLNKCTLEQQQIFKDYYVSVDEIKTSRSIDAIIGLCERTIKYNKKNWRFNLDDIPL